MIPRVAVTGTSFAGAGLYYLHDKVEDQVRALAGDDDPLAADLYYLHDKGEQTSNRVVFTETLNLPTRDAAKAMKCMSWTAAHATEIRQSCIDAEAHASGMTYEDYVRERNPFRGRKGEKPVYAYSLAWHPNQAPSHDDMRAAAKETIKALGFQDHQAVLVAHNDTDHPHIHVIVNRVHPRTGKYASYSRDRLKLSAWAEDYERRTGKILCWERVYNNEERRSRGGFVKAESYSRADHDWFEAHKDRAPDEIRNSRSMRQSGDRMALEADRRKKEAGFERRLEKSHGKPIAKVKAEIAKLEAELAAAEREKTERAKGVIAKAAKAFRLMKRALTEPARKQKGALAALTSNLGRLEQSREDARAVHVAKHAAAWLRMERRHVVERERDEDRIERLLKARGAKEKGERGKGAFNLRGHAETAKHTARDDAAQRRARTDFTRATTPIERREKDAASVDPKLEKRVEAEAKKIKTRNRERKRGERTGRTRSRRPKS